MTVVRELITRLGFRTDKAGIRSAEQGFAALKKAAFGVSAAAAAVGAGLAVITAKAIESGDEVAKAAKKIGIGAEALQELRFAADRAGVAEAELNVGLRSLQRRAAEAAAGNKEFAKGFATLGVRVTDANGKIKPTEQLLAEVADGMGTLSTQAQRTAAAMRVAGDSGFQLNNLFNQGSEGIEALRKRARSLGFVLNEEMTKELEEAQDALTDMRRVAGGLTSRIGVALLPVVKALSAGFISLFGDGSKINDMFKALRGFSEDVADRISKIAKGLKDSNAGWKDMEQLLVALSPFLLTFAVRLAKVFAPFAPAAIAIGAVVAVFAALGLVLEDLFTEGTGRQSILDQLSSSFDTAAAKGNAFAKTMSTAFNAVKALRDGLKDLSKIAGKVFQQVTGTDLGFATRPDAVAGDGGQRILTRPADLSRSVTRPADVSGNVGINQSVNITVSETNLGAERIQQVVQAGVQDANRQAAREFKRRSVK